MSLLVQLRQVTLSQVTCSHPLCSQRLIVVRDGVEWCAGRHGYDTSGAADHRSRASREAIVRLTINVRDELTPALRGMARSFASMAQSTRRFGVALAADSARTCPEDRT